MTNCRSRKLSDETRKDIDQQILKGRRHSHQPINGENSKTTFYKPDFSLDDAVHTNNSTKSKKSMEQIKQEYNQLGCQFYQIYHPQTQQNLQILQEDGSIGITTDSKNISSKSYRF